MHGTVGWIFTKADDFYLPVRNSSFFCFVWVILKVSLKLAFLLLCSQVRQPRKHTWVTTTSGSDLLENECGLSFICDWNGKLKWHRERRASEHRHPSTTCSTYALQDCGLHPTFIQTWYMSPDRDWHSCRSVWLGRPHRPNCRFSKLVLWPPFLSKQRTTCLLKRGHCERGRPQTKKK